MLAVTALLVMSIKAVGTQIKTISSPEGLSNNAILSMYQNNLGHLYIGTIDGLNIWDGKSIEIFKASDGYNYFFGNQVKYIIPGSEEKLYLHTTYGLAILDMITRDVRLFEELALCSNIAVTETGNVFFINSRNELQYLNTKTSELTSYKDITINEDATCYRLVLTKDRKLCIFTNEETYLVTFRTDAESDIRKIENLGLRCMYITPDTTDTGNHFLISQDHWLCTFNINDCSIKRIAHATSELLNRDSVSGIIEDKEGYLISFMQNGVRRLRHGEGPLEKTDIECGVFSMIRDKNQPIIWIGTDCNGIIRWSKTVTDISSITYDKLPYSIEMPIRSIYLDKTGALWFGTKGDGLYRIRDFSTKSDYDQSNTDRFNTENSTLSHDCVYSIAESSHNLFWIGCEGHGLNYYSYSTGRISKVAGSENLSYVHSIIEQDGSTLWVATDKHGCYRCRFEMRGTIPVMTDVEKISFTRPFSHTTSVFSMAMQNDSTIWFGSRGNGVLSYNTRTGKSHVVQFPAEDGLAFNETVFVTKSKDMLFATGNGLASYSPEKDTIFIPDFFPKKAAHSILTDGNDNIWITTNSGIISLTSDFNYRSSFDRFSGIEVLEYSDGACWRDVESRTMFFGGINGFTIINEDSESIEENNIYIPEIHITDFIQNNESYNIGMKMNKGKLKVPYSKSIFAIRFSVVDNLCYPDYRFSYKVEGYDDEWIQNPDNIIYMPSLDPGNYRLKIRYSNMATRYESKECCLPIYIIPPLYKRWYAFVIYGLFLSLIIYQIVRSVRNKYSSMKKRLKKHYEKEILKVKSETTSIITEELSAQITFILGLCQQIRQQTHNNQYVANKVNLVEYNIAKINKTLHILNEYKGISEDKTDSGETALIHVSQIAYEMLEIVKSGAKSKKITILQDIESGIILVTEKESFLTLFNSLIYKVISITSGKREVYLCINHLDAGGISIKIQVTTEESTYNEIISLLASNDMQSILVNETNDENISNFEFILCNKLVKEMDGVMEFHYIKDSGQMFITVELPQKDLGENLIKYGDSPISENINTSIDNHILESQTPNKHLRFIYLVSSNNETSTFLSYLLSEKYNIKEYNDNHSVLTDIRSHMPIVVLYDVSSMMGSFAEFMENTKENKMTSQIPVIALTSSLQITESEECTKLGADLCISFPFNMDYLHSALEKMLHKRESIAEYYKSPISTYVMSEGKAIHRDDKIFINSIFKIIDENLSNPELSASMIAGQLGLSTRVMYRKLEGITDTTLHQIIKNSRMEQAVKLLSSSKLTIDEIMYRVGHDNRSTFYRNFKEAKGMTPKEYRDSIKGDIMK